MERVGSSKSYFVQRIPADVRARAVGMTLQVPVGAAVVPVKIKAGTQAVRLSLRTRNAGETKARQAEVAGYIERVYAPRMNTTLKNARRAEGTTRIHHRPRCSASQ